MGPEGPHPEIGPDDLHVESQPAQTAPHVPERQAPWWRRLRRQRPNPDTQQIADTLIQETDEHRAQIRSDHDAVHRLDRAAEPENIIQPNNIEDLTVMMANSTAAQWRLRELNAQYGQGAGVDPTAENLMDARNWFNSSWRKAFMAGEFDFQINEDGEVQHNLWNRLAEGTRRTIKTLTHRQVLISVGLTAVVSVATGGIGLPALGALAGAVGGRVIGEAWEAFSGKEVRSGGQRLKLRELVAQEEFRDHFRLQEMATAIQAMEPTDDERNHRIRNLIEAYNHVNEDVVERQRQQLAEDAKWNARKNTCAKIGALSGLAGGVWAGFSGLAHQAMTMDIDGDGTSHLVEQVNGQWQFAYNTVVEALKDHAAGSHILMDNAGRLSHELGEPTWRVIWGGIKSLAPHILQVGTVAAGMIAGRTWEKYGEVEAVASFEQGITDQRHEAEGHTRFTGEQVPNHAEGFDDQATNRERWAEMFRLEERIPRNNQFWVVRNLGADPVIYRINTVNLDRGSASVTALDRNLQPLVDASGHHIVNENLNLTTLANFGLTSDEEINFWRGRVRPDGQINLQNLPIPIFTINGLTVPQARYRVVNDENRPGNVLLRRNGQSDLTVPILQLALLDVNQFDPARENQQQVARPERVVVGHVWHVENRADLPANLQDANNGGLPDHFAIESEDDNQIVVRGFNLGTGRTEGSVAIMISTTEWATLQANISHTHMIARAPQVANNAGGNAGGGNRGGGNRGGGNTGGNPGGAPRNP